MWSQDILTSVLFPYLIPSLPVCKEDCWPKEDFQHVLKRLLMWLSGTPSKRTRCVLKTFLRKTLSVSPSCQIEFVNDFMFLANIEDRSFFDKTCFWSSKSYLTRYASEFLLEHKDDLGAEKQFFISMYICYKEELTSIDLTSHLICERV
jgi:hypothetical protein